MTVLRRTWLATALFVLVSTTTWWLLIDWSVARGQFLQTVLLTPLIWWIVVGRQPSPRLWRGIVGGALAGIVTQAAQHIPELWNIFSLSRRNPGNGEDQAMAIAAVAVYLLIGVWATILGALVGLVAVVIQRRTDGGVPSS